MRNTDIESQKAISNLDRVDSSWEFNITNRKDSVLTGEIILEDETYVSSTDIKECFKQGIRPVSKCFMQCYLKIDIGDDLDAKYA
jgi:hypothetical protein